MNSKIAIVTGGGSGLGFAISEKFVQNGVKTIIVGRDKNKLREACKILGEHSSYRSFDLSNLSGIPELIGGILKDFGKIDILVNNAGIHHKKAFINVSDAEYQQVILTNQQSVFTISREVALVMIQNKQGVILNISSMASQYGIPNIIAYTAAKSAIEGMTRAMAVELAPSGIRVNCIAPGFINTDMSSKALNDDPERKTRVLTRTPMGRLGMPDDIANAAYFLCSEEAGYITGALLPVDGGNSIGF